MASGSRGHSSPPGGKRQSPAPSRPAPLIRSLSCGTRAAAQTPRPAAQERVGQDSRPVTPQPWGLTGLSQGAAFAPRGRPGLSPGLPTGTLRRRLHNLLGAARDRVLLFEAIDSSGGVHQLLAAGEERVARGADFHTHVALVGGARLEGVGARAGDINFVVSGVNSSLHVVTRGSFREFQYTRNSNPRAPFDTRGLNSLGDA